MAYADVSAVVNGALTEQLIAYTQAQVDEFVEHHERKTREDGLSTEVYVLWHEHENTVEDCACVQYLTDHNPYASFSKEG